MYVISTLVSFMGLKNRLIPLASRYTCTGSVSPKSLVISDEEAYKTQNAHMLLSFEAVTHDKCW